MQLMRSQVRLTFLVKENHLVSTSYARCAGGVGAWQEEPQSAGPGPQVPPWPLARAQGPHRRTQEWPCLTHTEWTRQWPCGKRT